jgi:hypothetical protein
MAIHCDLYSQYVFDLEYRVIIGIYTRITEIVSKWKSKRFFFKLKPNVLKLNTKVVVFVGMYLYD